MTQVDASRQLDPGRNHPRNFAISRGPIRRDDERKKSAMTGGSGGKWNATKWLKIVKNENFIFYKKQNPQKSKGFALYQLLKNMRFADSRKMRKPASTARFSKSKHLQKNQGFFASVLGRKQKSKNAGNPPKNFFIFVKIRLATKPWFFVK